jgi:hypothetical protein
MWIRDNELVLIAPWDFQSDRDGIKWQYIAAHANNLEQDGCPKDLRQMNDKVTGLLKLLFVLLTQKLPYYVQNVKLN